MPEHNSERDPMDDPVKKVVVHSNVTPEQRAELAKILDRLTGTPLARTGDISIEDETGKRLVISSQSGSSTAASVERPGGIEVVKKDDDT